MPGNDNENNALWDTHLHALSSVIKEGPSEFPTAVLVQITCYCFHRCFTHPSKNTHGLVKGILKVKTFAILLIRMSRTQALFAFGYKQIVINVFLVFPR